MHKEEKERDLLWLHVRVFLVIQERKITAHTKTQRTPSLFLLYQYFLYALGVLN
jgi:hypothetical protein